MDSILMNSERKYVHLVLNMGNFHIIPQKYPHHFYEIFPSRASFKGSGMGNFIPVGLLNSGNIPLPKMAPTRKRR